VRVVSPTDPTYTASVSPLRLESDGAPFDPWGRQMVRPEELPSITNEED
jgi:hypothetical protein